MNNKVSPSISIIVPVYNTQNYLRDCLDSLCKDTPLHNIEVICINDASTDNSLQILNEYASRYSYIKVVSYEKNRGGGHARNVGLKYASGEYLAFLDSDDISIPEVLEKLYLKVKKYDADIGICGASCFDVLNQRRFSMPWALRTDLLPDKEVLSFEDIQGFIFNFAQNWNCNKLFKRSFISKHKIKFQEIKRTNDLLFTCKALVLAGKITTLREELFIYRVNHGGSCQQTNDIYPFDFYRAFRALKKWLVKNKYFDDKVKKSFIEWALCGCVHNIRSIKDEDIRMILEEKIFGTGLNELNLLEHKKCIIAEPEAHTNFEKLLAQYNEEKKLQKQSRINQIFSITINKNKTCKIITILGKKIIVRLKQ